MAGTQTHSCGMGLHSGMGRFEHTTGSYLHAAFRHFLCYSFPGLQNRAFNLDLRLNTRSCLTHLSSPRLVFDILSGTDLGSDVLQVRQGCNRGDGGPRSERARRFGRSAHHSYLLHLLPRCAAATGRRFRGGRAAAAATIRSLGRLGCWKATKM